MPVSKNKLDRARRGAQELLTLNLGLSKGDVALIFCDESTTQAANLIVEQARSIGIHGFLRLIPYKRQLAYSQATVPSFDFADRDALSRARGVLTCLSDSEHTTNFRRDLVRFGTDRGRRLGHVPGLSLDLLADLGSVNQTRMFKRGEDLALALLLGREARLSTYQRDLNGQIKDEQNLVLSLGGLDRPPISSTGLIPLDTWGNIPGGEIFIAPIEDSAQGSFVLNGSFRGNPLDASSGVILEFQNGFLETIRGPNATRKKLESILRLHEKRFPHERHQLAELGIGLNDAITTLTGYCLLDEKASGTAHIAVGDNSRYGGNLQSDIHEDLITVKPSLWIDDKPILKNGILVIQSSDWREDLETQDPRLDLQSANLLLSRTPTLTHVDPVGRLCVRREVSAGRMCLYSVGTDDTSRVLASILSLVPPLPNTARAIDVRSRASQELSLTDRTILAAFTILSRHRLLQLTYTESDK